MKYSGLIFDFNGVLWFDTALQEKAWRDFSRQIRGRAFTQAEMDRHVHGRNNPYTLAYLTGRDLDDAEVRELIEAKESLYRRLCLQQGADFQLSPGAIPLLEDLQARGVPFTIATASEFNNVQFFVQHLHLDQWFDTDNIVYDDGSHPGKPNPAIFLKAADRLGLKPSQCVVIEDSLSGLQAAHRAGIGHIIALGPGDRHQRLAASPGVETVIETLAEVPRDRLFSQER